MLHIILVILKLIGILLAAVLLLLLLLCLLLLFVPLRYEIEGRRYPEVLEGSVRVSWLLHLICLRATYQKGELSAGVRIFWVSRRLFPTEEKHTDSRQRTDQTEADDGTGGNEEIQNLPQESKDAKKQIPKPEKDSLLEDVSADKREKEEQTGSEEAKQPSGRESLPVRIWEWIKEKLLGICRLLQKLSQGMKNLKRKARAWKKQLSGWIELFGSDLFRGVIRRYRGYLFELLGHIRLRKAKGKLHFGFEDPSLTGQLAGVLYVLLPASCGKVQLLPDFQKTVLEGEVIGKGHIRLCHLAKIGWKAFWDKELRRLIKKMRA